jgi:glycosidase
VWTNTSSVVPYVQGDELDLAFDFDLADAFVKSVFARRTDTVARVLTVDANWFKPLQFATFLTNHDQARAMSFFRNNVAEGESAASLLLASPGVPFIYYGEEIGMIGLKPDEMIRTPMQWSADANAGFTTGTPWETVYSDYNQKNVATESENPTSLLDYYREMIALRSQHAALRVGAFFPVDTGNIGLIAFLRSSPDENILVLLNLAQETINNFKLVLKSGPLKGVYQAAPLIGQGAFEDLAVNGQGGFDDYHPVPELGPNQTLILQLQSK